MDDPDDPGLDALDALDALERTFSGGRPGLGERVAATRARAAAANAPATPDATPTPEPPVQGPAPPEGEDGPWVWIRHPQGRGVALCRAVEWVRTASGAWALRVDLPVWASHSVPGGVEVGDAQAFQLAPTDAVITIPGQDYRTLSRS